MYIHIHMYSYICLYLRVNKNTCMAKHLQKKQKKNINQRKTFEKWKKNSKRILQKEIITVICRQRLHNRPSKRKRVVAIVLCFNSNPVNIFISPKIHILITEEIIFAWLGANSYPRVARLLIREISWGNYSICI